MSPTTRRTNPKRNTNEPTNEPEPSDEQQTTDEQTKPKDMEEIVEQLLAKMKALEWERSGREHIQKRPRAIMPDVEKFDGKSYMRFRMFMTEMKEKQSVDCEALGGERGFVSYVYSRLTGRARDRIGPYMESYYSTPDDAKALETFYAFLEETFTDPTAEQQAAERLNTTKMGNRPIEEYIAQMELLFLQANGANWPDLVKITSLKQGLSVAVSMQMKGMKFPDKYTEFKKQLLALGT